MTEIMPGIVVRGYGSLAENPRINKIHTLGVHDSLIDCIRLNHALSTPCDENYVILEKGMEVGSNILL